LDDVFAWLLPQLVVEQYQPDGDEPAGALEILRIMLAWTIYLSFAGALLEALLPKDKPALARWSALVVALAGCVLACSDSLQV